MEDDGGASIYTIDEAKVLFPLLDFHDIFQSHDIPNRPLKVYIYDETPYFSELIYFSNIMDESRSINRNSLMDFILVHKTLREAPRLDNQVRMLFPDSPFQTRSSLCVDDVLDKFSLLAGRFYAMLSFKDGEQDRLLLDSISENIKSALHNRIEMANWLDSDTRDAAIKKVFV
jgi:predicted metalloendopeptidase